MNALKNLASKLTYANIIATLALFIALSGVSYAATKLPKNSVGTDQIKNGAVTSKKIDKKTLASLTGDPGAAGTNGANGKDGKDGASDIWTDDGTNVAIPSDGEFHDIASVTVPAGNFFISANESVFPGSNSTTGINCGVYDGTSTYQAQNYTPPGTGNAAFTFSQSLTKTYANSTTLTIRCGAAGAQGIGTISLSALKVTTVH